MKKILLIIALLFAGLFQGLSQIQPSPSQEEVDAELARLHSQITLAYGFNDVVNFDVPSLTRAPRGYEPFLISHYGRHGSRYAWNKETYTFVLATLRREQANGNLTPMGEELLAEYEPFVEKCLPHYGELTLKGWEQHQMIARTMYRSFLPLFMKNPVIRATASSSPRAIMSMSSFCLGLQKCDDELDILEELSPTLYDLTIPDSSNNPNRLPDQPDYPLDVDMSRSAFAASVADYPELLSRFFVNTEIEESTRFLQELLCAYVGLRSLDFEVDLPEVFTDDDFIAYYMSDCYNAYRESRRRLQYSPILREMEKSVELALASERPMVRLCFGHDYVIQQHLALCGVGPFARDITAPEQAIVAFPVNEVPMGANVQFIFYRSKKGDDVLVKVLLNGKESTLPCEPVSGPYYRWSDYKEFVDGQLSKVK